MLRDVCDLGMQKKVEGVVRVVRGMCGRGRLAVMDYHPGAEQRPEKEVGSVKNTKKEKNRRKKETEEGGKCNDNILVHLVMEHRPIRNQKRQGTLKKRKNGD